jgi:dihydropteroate synthase
MPARDDGAAVVGFVTGRLAEYSLRRVLDGLAPSLPFEPRVITLNIAVAALMTTEWVARHLELPAGVARLVLPGLCKGDIEALAGALGVAVERGPKDLRELPLALGRAGADEPYGEHDIEILAEINHVERLPLAEVLAFARRYRRDGADVIDLGYDPGASPAGVREVVRALRDEGLRVSIDSLDPAQIEPAVSAGAELVLSVNRSNIDAARALGCEVVVIPDEPSSLAGLDASLEKLAGWGVEHRVDPVLEPLGFGFARSLGRYIEVRERYPGVEMLMGVGNLTELTDADSAAINVLLLGFCEELGIHSVLTTEVIHWARTSVRECDLARRLVHFACRERTIPKHREPLLHLLRDERLLEHGDDVLAKLAEGIKDANFRIFAERGEIHVLSRDGHLRGRDPFELFERLEVADPSHAFYLGYEMAKAVTALTLGKNYVQDEALRWGFLTVEEESHLERRAKRRGLAAPSKTAEKRRG